MENLGYKEGFAKTKKMHRQVSRGPSVGSEEEITPLSTSRYVFEMSGCFTF